jgi:5-methylthioadenosine/S-adenosylhomocysteine deaminase
MIYRAHFVLPMSGDPIEDGEVLVRNGRIEAIGTSVSEAMPDERVEDLGHVAILPGLVNVHCHLDYTIARGQIGDEPFLPWIRSMKKIGDKLEHSDFLSSARMGALQMVRSGVTAIGDSTFSGAVIQAAKEAGLRGIVYQETFGPDPSGEYQEQVDQLSDKIRELASVAGDRLTVGISPHSVYTSSERLLRLVADLARDDGLPVALHVAETQDEVVLIESAAGHIADLYRLFRFDFDARGMTPVEYLHEIGILGPKTIAAHCVHLTQSDMDTLAEEETRVAHCPKSNAKLGVGTAQLNSIVGRGIVTGIGTDSAASSDSLDMFDEMRFAVLVQRAVHSDVKAMDAKRVLELATLGGATALGMEQEIGSLEEGKRADLIAVDLSKPSAFPCADPYSAVVYCCSSSDVILNMIDGEIVYRSGEYSRVDASEIKLQASLAVAKL